MVFEDRRAFGETAVMKQWKILKFKLKWKKRRRGVFTFYLFKQNQIFGGCWKREMKHKSYGVS